MPDKMPEYILNKMVDIISDIIPNKLSKSMAEYILDRISKYIEDISKYMSRYILTCYGGDHSKKIIFFFFRNLVPYLIF